SELRKEERFQGVSMVDIYKYPTVRSLARHVNSVSERRPPPAEAMTDRESTSPAPLPANEFRPILAWKHFACGTAQAIGLYFVLGIYSLQWLAPYLTYTWLVDDGFALIEALAGSLSVLLLLYPLLLFLAVAVKWCVIGRY